MLPDYVEKYLNRINPESRQSSRQKEEDAYFKMKSCIDREEDALIKEYMQDTLLYLCNESMLFSYFYEQCWEKKIQEQRTLQKKIQPMELYIQLEDILASQSNSYEYTKTFSSHRYPLTVPGNFSGETKVRDVNETDFLPARFVKSYYKFGVHTYHVGSAIRNILDCLEERYSLNFKELESTYQESLKK